MEVKCLIVYSRDLVNGCDYCLYSQQTVCRLGRCGLQQSPPQPVKMLKLLPRFQKDSKTPEWKRTLQKSCTLSLSLTLTHLCAHIFMQRHSCTYIRAEIYRHKDQCCSSVAGMRLQPTETIGLGRKRVGKRSKYCGQAWQGKSRTTAGSRWSKSYGSSDFPCQLHFPIFTSFHCTCLPQRPLRA